MSVIAIRRNEIPEDLAGDIARRDVTLWVGATQERALPALRAIVGLLSLPWSLALTEISDPELRDLLRAESDKDGALQRARGFVHPVESDPATVELPRRALPVYFLNGVSGSTSASGLAAMRQRLNMLAKLQAERPRRLLVLTEGSDQPFNDITQLWRDGFRCLITVISASEAELARFERWAEAEKLQSITLIHEGLPAAAEALVRRVKALLPDDRIVVRVREAQNRIVDVDITECELTEHPILDRYEIIQSRDLTPMLAEELSEEDFRSFFDRSRLSWAPYAAGLAWDRDVSAKTRLVRILNRLSENGSEANTVGYVLAESGAGGTTMARNLAYEAALAGYPALVARQGHFRPESTEIASFLFRVKQRLAEATGVAGRETRATQEMPWVLAFDVTHWAGYLSELRRLSNDLSRSGRPVLIIVVCNEVIGEELQKSRRAERLAVLTHELSQEEALALGQHLNKFLKPYRKDKSSAEWLRFWHAHRPTEQSSITAFWVALEFWMKGQFDLSESIQSWIRRQFKAAQLDQQARKVILQIAAMTIERHTLPEQLLPETKGALPISVILERLRQELPALALIRENIDSQRHWALAHDLLGRYLINATFFDRALLTESGYQDAEDPILLRLQLIGEVARNPLLAQKSYAPLALEFAVKLLKLDENGNAEFFRYWRAVLAILESMPDGIRRTSRTFNHHVAISRRRVATHDDQFDATDDDKREQLILAIRELEFALNDLDRGEEDEPDLNLWNSLALAYQNLADFELRSGADPKRVAELRSRANAATARAVAEDPTNSYVLETAARNLLQQGQIQDHDAVICASEALGYVFQAVALDRSVERHHQLTRLANHALKMLRASASTGIDSASTEPHLALARAWLALTDGVASLETNQIAMLPPSNLQKALDILTAAPEAGSNWLIVKFRYDLLVLVAPRDFDGQLRLLDELEGAGIRVPFQMQLERAILLHQRNRHPEANIEFQNLRNKLRAFDVIVEVPKRLAWLLTPDGTRYRLCEARVAEDSGHRGYAQVVELKSRVPFRPEEFGRTRMPVGMKFKCNISFGPMGPFLRPPSDKPVDAARFER
jgi:hypothetical protein